MAIDFTALNNACVLYYSMDNADVSGSTILDLTPNNNDGTINGATTGVTGKINQSCSFDGTNDYVEVPHNNGLNVGTGDFSLSVWFKSSSSNSRRSIITKGLGVDYLIRLGDATDGQDRLLFSVDDSTTRYTITSSNTYADNNWHHVTAIKEGNYIKLYVDGIEAATPINIGNHGSLDNNEPLLIGMLSTNIHNFNGDIDEIGIWNRALNQEEVTYLYANGTPTVNQQYPFSAPAVYEIKGQVTLSGTATQGATLRLYDQTGGTYEGSTTTDVSGNYLFENLTDGNEYHVSVEYDDGTTKYNDESKPYVTPTEQ